MAGQIIVHFHEPDGDETIKPGIGSFFHDTGKSLRIGDVFGLFPDDGHEIVPLGDSVSRNDSRFF